LRLCLGLSQKKFAEKLGVTKDWARHMEAGRRKIVHLKIANRYVGNINTLLNQRPITLKRALKNWRGYQFARDQNLSSIEVKIKSFLEMDEDDFKGYFELISGETEGFTKFSPNLLTKIPQSVLILRIVLGICHRKFARLIGTGSRALRKYEHAEMKMKSETATKFTENIRRFFGGNSVLFTNALENFRYFKGVYGYGELNSFLERGLKFAERIPPNALETRVQLLLENAGIPFKMHARVTGLKRDYNVDFAIPDDQAPSVLIEVIQTQLMPKKNKNYRLFISLIDHKFQMIKARHPNIFTALIFYCNGPPLIVERARDMIKIETLNTDAYALKEEELEDFIQKIRFKLVEVRKGK